MKNSANESIRRLFLIQIVGQLICLHINQLTIVCNILNLLYNVNVGCNPTFTENMISQRAAQSLTVAALFHTRELTTAICFRRGNGLRITAEYYHFSKKKRTPILSLKTTLLQ